MQDQRTHEKIEILWAISNEGLRRVLQGAHLVKRRGKADECWVDLAIDGSFSSLPFAQRFLEGQLELDDKAT